jgi:hypothetical protein
MTARPPIKIARATKHMKAAECLCFDHHFSFLIATTF